MRAAVRALLSSLLVAAAAGCSCGAPDEDDPPIDDDGGEQTADSGTSEEDAGTDAGLQFLSRVEAYRDGGIIFEQIDYESQGLLIKGELCRPEDESRPGPLVIRNHDGWSGIGAESFDSLCLQLASRGVVLASSHYRGEGGSEGIIEFCHGEVADVRKLLAIMRAQPFVKADRVGMVGTGHGACITLQAANAEPDLKAVVDVDGYGLLSAAHKFWDRQLQYNEPPPCPADGGDVCSLIHSQHLNVVETATGGRPSGFPLSYEVRSPTRKLSLTRAPLLMIQAENDIITHYTQSCAKRAELQTPSDGGTGRNVSAWYLDSNQASASWSVSCGGAFATGPAPDPKVEGSLSSSQTYLFVMGGEGFPYKGRAEDHVRGLVLRFLLDRLLDP